jgi:hypothetical protein
MQEEQREGLGLDSGALFQTQFGGGVLLVKVRTEEEDLDRRP